MKRPFVQKLLKISKIASVVFCILYFFAQWNKEQYSKVKIGSGISMTGLGTGFSLQDDGKYRLILHERNNNSPLPGTVADGVRWWRVNFDPKLIKNPDKLVAEVAERNYVSVYCKVTRLETMVRECEGMVEPTIAKSEINKRLESSEEVQISEKNKTTLDGFGNFKWGSRFSDILSMKDCRHLLLNLGPDNNQDGFDSITTICNRTPFSSQSILCFLEFKNEKLDRIEFRLLLNESAVTAYIKALMQDFATSTLYKAGENHRPLSRTSYSFWNKNAFQREVDLIAKPAYETFAVINEKLKGLFGKPNDSAAVIREERRDLSSLDTAKEKASGFSVWSNSKRLPIRAIYTVDDAGAKVVSILLSSKD